MASTIFCLIALFYAAASYAMARPPPQTPPQTNWSSAAVSMVLQTNGSQSNWSQCTFNTSPGGPKTMTCPCLRAARNASYVAMMQATQYCDSRGSYYDERSARCEHMNTIRNVGQSLGDEQLSKKVCDVLAAYETAKKLSKDRLADALKSNVESVCELVYKNAIPENYTCSITTKPGEAKSFLHSYCRFRSVLRHKFVLQSISLGVKKMVEEANNFPRSNIDCYTELL